MHLQFKNKYAEPIIIGLKFYDKLWNSIFFFFVNRYLSIIIMILDIARRWLVGNRVNDLILAKSWESHFRRLFSARTNS